MYIAIQTAQIQHLIPPRQKIFPAHLASGDVAIGIINKRWSRKRNVITTMMMNIAITIKIKTPTNFIA